MKSLSRATSAAIVLALVCQSAQAQYGCCNSGSICESFCSGYRANVMWPSIFVPPARRGVCETYAVMANNGWRRQNLLGDYHFNPETNELTKAGEMKVQWILTQAPPDRRSVFVQRAQNQMQTASRVASVHQLASTMSPAVGSIDVNDTHLVAEGHSAGTVDKMFVDFQSIQSQRYPPVLPINTSVSD